tara:strand:- start:38 stop:346 length:309 start_codon:yes stop_codon:yes gene_type:complete
MITRHNPNSACTDDSINKDRLLAWGNEPERQAENELFYLRARTLRERELVEARRALGMDTNNFGGDVRTGHDDLEHHSHHHNNHHNNVHHNVDVEEIVSDEI